jgi:predicted  nucleic acid-binding Zn-ribbon protein
MTSNQALPPCPFYQTGHCREMNKTCKFSHSQQTCWRQICDKAKCLDRHPNPCILFFTVGQGCYWPHCNYRHLPPQHQDPMLHQEHINHHQVLLVNSTPEDFPPPDQILKQLQEKLTSHANEIQALNSSIGGLETQIEQLNKLIQNIPAPPASCGCGEKLTELSNKYVSKEETDKTRHSSIEHEVTQTKKDQNKLSVKLDTIEASLCIFTDKQKEDFEILDSRIDLTKKRVYGANGNSQSALKIAQEQEEKIREIENKLQKSTEVELRVKEMETITNKQKEYGVVRVDRLSYLEGMHLLYIPSPGPPGVKLN